MTMVNEKPTTRGLPVNAVLDILQSKEHSLVLADRYGVNRDTIHKIRQGRRYWNIYKAFHNLPDDTPKPTQGKPKPRKEITPENPDRLIAVKRIQPKRNQCLDSEGADVELVEVMTEPMGAQHTAANKMLMQAWV